MGIRILDDKREIDAIVWGDNAMLRVGHGGVTKIIGYEEVDANGQGIWFAVYMGERIRYRVNAQHITIVDYGLPEELLHPTGPKLVTPEG